MKWSGQHIYDLVSRFRNTVDFSEDVTFYQPVNDANPQISIGANDDERLQIYTDYQGTTTQSMQSAVFQTRTESATANDGRFQFYVDETPILQIDDDGLDLYTGFGIAINGTDILTDSGGTATLSNIDAIDATTKATLESALTDSTTDSLVIDTNRSAAQGTAGAEMITALHIDFDRAVPTSGTHGHRDLGIDLDVNSAGLGTHSVKGMDIDVVGTADGTSMATGIDLLVSGAETNIGMVINTTGTHIKLEANADVDDYATFIVADTGDLTIATVGDGTTDSDLILDADGVIDLQPADGKSVRITSTEASSSTTGGKLNLISNDGAALGDDHRLGRLGFLAAEDAGSTYRLGASIQAMADAAWSASENGTRLEFWTMDGNNTSELSLTLDSNLLATFAGAVTVTGTITGDVTGALTGQAATVATIAGLAPNTATTQATQPAIESIGTDGDTLGILGDKLQMYNTTTNKPEIELQNRTDDATGPIISFANNRQDSGTQAGEDNDVLGKMLFVGYDDQPAIQTYASIIADIHDATSGEESGRLTFKVANHDGGDGSGLILTGGSENNEIDVTVGLGAASVVTVPGKVEAQRIDLVASNANIAFDSVTIISDSSGTATLSNIDALDATTAGTFTRVGSGRRYGSTIKILPSDFMINDDAASPLSFKDGSNSGVHVNDAANEAIAFVTIPEGMKATHVDVFATHNRTLTVDELDVDGSYDFTGTAKGIGNCNTQLDITDVNATATNYLAITVSLTATSNRVWGGVVTIAPQ